MPFVPLCYRSGVLMYSSAITPAPDCDYNNYFKNIDQWSVIREEHVTGEVR